MKILIIEDESRASERLQNLLLDMPFDIEVLAILDSVRSAKAWFEKNPLPEGIISDIQLGDGRAFEIYKDLDKLPPVIFTTAYDQYAIKAFKNNGIDYLLKPIDEEELEPALKKMQQMLQRDQAMVYEKMDHLFSTLKKDHKSRFMIKAGGRLRSIPIEEVEAFYSYSGDTYIFTADAHSYAVDYTIDQLEELIDPNNFFRINRAVIAAYNAIDTIHMWSGSRLKIELNKEIDVLEDDIVVSRERVKEFKAWLDR